MELSWRGVSTVCTRLGAGSLLPGNILCTASKFTLSFKGNSCNKMAVYLFCSFNSVSETLCILDTHISSRFQVVSVFFQYTFQGFFSVPLNSQLLCEMLFQAFYQNFFFLATGSFMYGRVVTTFLEENICFHFKSHWHPQASFLQSLLCN